ncbi:ATP12-domain-containing protein [Mycena floridula]|nr:ATP12-domain-containing protein [Mycena floridula]
MLLSLARCSARCSRFNSVRWQSTVIDGPAITATNRAEVTLKRFWKTADVESLDGNLVVTLDKRPLKTPSGNLLVLPQNKRVVATLIAAEWQNQKTVLKHHALPMTSLVTRAIDSLAEENTRTELVTSLLEYLSTDTICFYHHKPERLVELQTEHWDPLHQWVQQTYGVEMIKFTSVLSNLQPVETRRKLGEVLAGFDRWELAAFERATHITKSFIIALALVTKHITVEQASEAARVEVLSQIDRWGEVEDTHDVDFFDTRRELGSAACLLSRI